LVVEYFSVNHIPAELSEKINSIGKVLTIEEHQGECGMHETLASLFLQNGNKVNTYIPLYATGYPSGKYGNQLWHQEENGLAGIALRDSVQKLINA
jgi:transketolase